jgi:tryptophanyl-tRNA synthetase
MKLDPWGSATFQDYSRLRDEFGIEEFTDNLWNDFTNPHMLIRRGVIFGHRGFQLITDAVKYKKKWAILTGLMPSGRMHLGHKMVIDEVIYYQSIGADINIAVADIESFATRSLTLKETENLAINEYIINYIALGLKPEKCRIYFQSKNQDVKDLAYILGKKINWSQMQATYGFNGQTNMSHVFSPLVQTGDILHVQLEKYGSNRPTLVPVGVDQDPHIRLSRDIAQAHRLFNVILTKDNKIGVFLKIEKNISELLDIAEKKLKLLNFKKLKRITEYKAIYIEDANENNIQKIDEALAKSEIRIGGYGFYLPSASFHRFMTGLTGDKMSSSKPESAIFLTDTPKESVKKIMQAKTGGAVTLEEQKKYGGKPDKCVIYELFLYHLIENDDELMNIFNKCKKGEKICGECKKYAAKLMEKLLLDIQEKREKVRDKIKNYLD